MNMRQFLGNLNARRTPANNMSKTKPRKAGIAWQAVRDDCRAFGDVITREAFQDFSRCGLNPAYSDLTSGSAFRLNRANNKRLPGPSPATGSFCGPHPSRTHKSLV